MSPASWNFISFRRCWYSASISASCSRKTFVFARWLHTTSFVTHCTLIFMAAIFIKMKRFRLMYIRHAFCSFVA